LRRRPLCAYGASNFFKVAVAAAIGLFGFDSAAALATVVGVLIVPGHAQRLLDRKLEQGLV
jgi:ACR3 family arsenite efflux pump ArsB